MSIHFDFGATNTELVSSFASCYECTLSLTCIEHLVSSQALDTLAQLIDDPNPAIVKVVIQCLASVYPLLFRQLYVRSFGRWVLPSSPSL